MTTFVGPPCSAHGFLVWQVRLCVSTAVCFYCFVALIGLCASVTHDAKRPSAILSLVLFFVLGWLYASLHTARNHPRVTTHL